MPLRVIVWATGEVGSRCLREVLENPAYELAGLLVYSDAKEGQDAGSLAGLGPVGVIATRDKNAVIGTDADLVIHCPMVPSPEELHTDVTALLASGKDVITTVGYFAPEFTGSELVERLEGACAEGGSTLLGTGIEPGFMFDRLAPVISSLCADVDQVHCIEVCDAADHPAAMMIKEAMGFGKPPEEVTPNTPFGQYFRALFSEMAVATARGIGVTFDRIESGVRVATTPETLDIAVGTIPAGTVAGTCWWVDGYFEARVIVKVEIFWNVSRGVGGWPEPKHRYQWRVLIEGRPSVSMVLDTLPTLDSARWDTAEMDPAYEATMALVMNAAPAVAAAKPGILHAPAFGAWRPRGAADRTEHV